MEPISNTDNQSASKITECFAMAYYPNGDPKRTVGIYYKDLGYIWTREMERASRK